MINAASLSVAQHPTPNPLALSSGIRSLCAAGLSAPAPLVAAAAVVGLCGRGGDPASLAMVVGESGATMPWCAAQIAAASQSSSHRKPSSPFVAVGRRCVKRHRRKSLHASSKLSHACACTRVVSVASGWGDDPEPLMRSACTCPSATECSTSGASGPAGASNSSDQGSTPLPLRDAPSSASVTAVRSTQTGSRRLASQSQVNSSAAIRVTQPGLGRGGGSL